MWLMFLPLVLSGMSMAMTTTSPPISTTTMPSASQLLNKLRQKYPVLFEQTKSTVQTTTEITPPLPKLELVALQIQSRIEHRYAITRISARLLNPAHVIQPGKLALWLPEEAFISAYSTEKNGRIYNAFVGEKSSEERKIVPSYTEDQAGDYFENARDTKRFVASIPLEPGSHATFNLTYEELIKRKMSTYTHILTLNPILSTLRDLDITIDIKEARPIAMLRVTPFSNDLLSDPSLPEHINSTALRIDWPEESKEAHIKFNPKLDEQKFLIEDNAKNLVQFIVQYDIDRSDAQPNQILVQDDYLVQFFAAPTSLKLLRKHVIFVLDVSGSMEGRKITQLKQAMTAILDELSPNDYFNLIEFSYSVTVWNLDSRAASVVYTPSTQEVTDNNLEIDSRPMPAFAASKEYIDRAKAIISRMRAGGGTNMYDTLVTATRVAQRGLANVTLAQLEPTPRPMIVFLTDGEPTVGQLDPERILAVTRRCNVNPRAAIFSLAFGEDADHAFLRRLALTNGGFVRKIYEASDASEQLRTFFRQIASPLLTNVTFKYGSHQVEEATMTRCEFSHAFAGSELVVAGHLRNGLPVSVQVEGVASDGHHSIPITIGRETMIPVGPNTARLERIWAYLTINQLLEAAALDQEEALVVGGANERALYLSLRYGFLTPLTSLLLEKADGTNDSFDAIAISPRAQHRYTMRSASSAGVHTLKIVDAESLTWLMAAIGNSSNEGEPPVMLSSIRSGLRYAANRTADIPYQRCVHVAHPDAYCRHFKFCALNLDYETYSRSYHCEIGGGYLGVCCPEWLHEQVADPISS